MGPSTESDDTKKKNGLQSLKENKFIMENFFKNLFQ